MSNELCVTTAAVSLSGETGETVAPEPGDQVTLTVEGKVSRVEGDSVYVQAESANGEPVMGSNAEVPEDIDEEMASLKTDLGKEARMM